jgi:HK97 family phage portal protein
MILKKIIDKILKKDMFGNVATMIITPGKAQWQSADYISYVTDGLQRNPYLYAAIDLIATEIQQLNIYPQIIDKSGNVQEPPTTHPLMYLLNNPLADYYTSLQMWMAEMAIKRLLGGAAYAVALSPTPFGTPNPKPPSALIPVGVDRMAVIPGDTLRTIQGYEYKVNNSEKIKYLPFEVFAWRNIHPINWSQNLSPLASLERAIELNNDGQDFNKAVIDNGGMVGTCFTTDSPTFGREQAMQARQSFDDKYAGKWNAGKTFFAWGGLKPIKFGLSPAEMAYDKMITLTARQIASAFHIPPEMLGDTETKTFANFAEARQTLYLEAVLPLAYSLTNSLARFLSQRFQEKIVLNIDLDSITAIAEIREKQKESIRKDFTAQLITRSEARQQLGWAAEDDGGEYYRGNEKLLLDEANGKSWKANLVHRQVKL